MEIADKIDWFCKTTWSKSAYNTLWCLIGCSIGDFGTIYYFQITPHSLSVFLVMLIAIINGIITSIILETIILLRQKFKLMEAFKNSLWDVAYQYGFYGISDELDGLFNYGFSKIGMVGSTYNVVGWIFNTLALQLLETEKI